MTNNKLDYIISFILFVALFANASCKKVKETNYEESILINLNDKFLNNASQVFEDIKYLQIDAGRDEPIGDIVSLKVFDNIIVVFDEQQEKLFIFDTNGVYLSTINNKGKGPGEYLSLSDYNIVDDCIFVLTNRSNVDKYSLDGNFIERIGSSPFFSDQFQVENDEYFLLSQLSDDKNRIYIFDKKFNLKTRDLPYKDANVPLFNFWPAQSMLKADGNIYFYLPEEYGVFQYSEQKIIPKYKYSFNGLSVNIDELTTNDIDSDILPVIRGVYFVDDYLITQVFYNKILYQHIYSFSSKKSKLFKAFEINNDMTDLPLLWSYFYGACNKNLYAVIPIELFDEYPNDNDFPNGFSPHNDNSVIGVFSIKNF